MQKSTPDKIISLSISSEIQRFESVHPSIYSIYELIEHLEDTNLSNLIREHVVNIEDSFVNSQEWTLSRSVPTINIGILGSIDSQKSTLVHRYLTNTYLEDNSPEGGRFKKEILLNSKPTLLLIRDEGQSMPELQFTHWCDVLILCANSVQSVQACYNCISRLASYKALNEIPILLVSIGKDETFANEFKKIPHSGYVNVDVTTGRNVEVAFLTACNLLKSESSTPSILRKNNNRKSLMSKNNVILHQGGSNSSCGEVGSGRVIPLKQGYLLKKSAKKWKKKYAILTNYTLNYYESINAYMENASYKLIDLKHANVKKIDLKKLQVTTLDKVFEFECANCEERDSWVQFVEKQVFISLKGIISNNLVKTDFNWRDLLTFNKHCADCKGENCINSWVSINFGVVVCISCSGIHRNLGSHISKIRSLQLDDLSPPTLQILQNIGGNEKANALYEYNLPPHLKITSSSTLEEKSKFIRRKYENLQFLPPELSEFNSSQENLLNFLRNSDFMHFLCLLIQFDKNKLNSIAFQLLRDLIEEHADCAYFQSVIWAFENMEETERLKIKNSLCSLDPDVQALIDNF